MHVFTRSALFDRPPQQLPEELHQAEVQRERVRRAMDHVTRQVLRRVNPTDQDTWLIEDRWGIMPACNPQTMVSPLDAA